MPVFWILAILKGVYWYLIVCNSVVTSHAGLLFICLLAISSCISTFVRYSSVWLFHPFLLGSSISYCWVLRVFCIFWIKFLYQRCPLQIVSLSRWLSFHSLHILFFSIFYCCSSTVVAIFTPSCPPAHPSQPPTREPTPLGFIHVSFIHIPWWPSPCYARLALSPSSFLHRAKVFIFTKIKLINLFIHELHFLCYLKTQCQIRGHPGFLLCYFWEVLYFCILFLSFLWFILS